MAKNISYFAEERLRNNNPNFFMQRREDELRKQVKRIIRDIKNNTIEQQDLNYFKNDRIISACIEESYKNFIESFTMINALTHYINTVLTTNIPTLGLNVPQERVNASNLITAYNNKLIVYRIAYYAFLDIGRGGDIMMALSNIVQLDKKLFYDL